MSFLNREEVQLGSHLLTVKERIAEGGFGFVDLVTNSVTGTDYVVCLCILFTCSKRYFLVKTMRYPTTREL